MFLFLSKKLVFLSVLLLSSYYVSTSCMTGSSLFTTMRTGQKTIHESYALSYCKSNKFEVSYDGQKVLEFTLERPAKKVGLFVFSDKLPYVVFCIETKTGEELHVFDVEKRKEVCTIPGRNMHFVNILPCKEESLLCISNLDPDTQDSTTKIYNVQTGAPRLGDISDSVQAEKAAFINTLNSIELETYEGGPFTIDSFPGRLTKKRAPRKRITVENKGLAQLSDSEYDIYTTAIYATE